MSEYQTQAASPKAPEAKKGLRRIECDLGQLRNQPSWIQISMGRGSVQGLPRMGSDLSRT